MTHLFNLLGPVGVVWLIVDWVIRITALFVVPRNRKPSSGTAWLLLIFFFPIFGIFLFIVLGSPKLPKQRRALQKTSDKIVAGLLKELRKNRDTNKLLNAEPPEKYVHLAKLSESLTGFPVFQGNNVEVLPEYDDVIKRIVKDIDAAKQYVLFEYFIISFDNAISPIFDALARAEKRGVFVRVLYDSLNSKRYPGYKKMVRRFQSDGIKAVAMLPLKFPGRGYVRPDLRNHRKLTVIDGTIGYTGSLNMIRRDYHRKDDLYYDEMVVRLHGPIVLQLAAVFLTDWFSETGEFLNNQLAGKSSNSVRSHGSSLLQILPSGPGYDDENNLKLFTNLLHLAQRKVVIVNPYFVPDDALTTAITSATRRGVDVVMINSEIMDQWMVGHAQRSFYEDLLKAGVKIYLYNAPILLHSKFITVDDDIATVGSSNLDIRSFQLDLEVTLISYDPKVVRALERVEQKYLAKSKRIQLSQWQKRPRMQNLMDNIARLTASLQ